MMDDPSTRNEGDFSHSKDSSRIKSLALFSFANEDAMATLRVLGPAKLAGWEIIRGYNFDDRKVHIEAVDQADVVLIQREYCRDYDAYVKFTALSHTQNKPVIIDLDDNLFILPKDHPDRLTGYYVDSLIPTLQAIMDADLVTVATQPLRDYLLPYNPNIRIIPNYLDDTLWQITPPVIDQEQTDKITIGYMGGNTHKPDLQMVLPVLLRLLEMYPDQINFHFWGIEAPPEIAAFTQVDWYPPVFYRYEDFVTRFQTEYADLLIAPLVDNPFNACKSAIKFLEYGARGIPGIYSRVRPYTDIVEDGVDGLLVSTPDEWLAALSALIENPAFRAQLVENAQTKIKRDWLLSKNVDKRIKIFEDTVLHYQPRDEDASPFYLLSRSLSEQYYEERLRWKAKLQEKDDYIHEVHQHLANKDQIISDLNQLLIDRTHALEEEILSYATSSSWRLTRPLRGIMRRVRGSRRA